MQIVDQERALKSVASEALARHLPTLCLVAGRAVKSGPMGEYGQLDRWKSPMGISHLRSSMPLLIEVSPTMYFA